MDPRTAFRAWHVSACIALAMAAASAQGACPSARHGRLVLEGGRGDELTAGGVGWELPLEAACDEARNRWQLGALIRVDRWRGREPAPAPHSIWDASITPFLRWRVAKPFDARLYLEGGIGVHLLSHTRINSNRELGTAFQFGEYIGASLELGREGQYSLGMRLQHISNGGVKRPNDGITYPMIVFSTSF
jgi:hypothetical protein